MGRVVTITSGKGGVGKTTATANIAAALAMHGHSAVAVDADIGLRNLDVVMGLENRIVYDIVDVVEGRCRLRQALIKDKKLPELFLLPASQTRDKDSLHPDQMSQLCSDLRQQFDYILVDSPAGIERGFKVALAPADDVLIVTTPEVSAVRDADRVIGLVDAAEKGPARLIINRIKKSMVNRGDMLSPDDVLDILAVDIIGLVPEDEDIVVSTNRGMPLVLDGNHRAGRSFSNIALRLTGQEVPMTELEYDEGIWSRILRFIRQN